MVTKVKGSVWDSGDNGLAVNVQDFGIKGDGTTDDTDAINLLITDLRDAGGGHAFFPAGEYLLSNVSVTGLKDVKFSGAGNRSTIFNFNQVSSGTGLYIGWDATYGGSQRIVLEDIGLTDDRSTSLIDTMFKFESGLTGQSPSQASGSLSVIRGGIIKYNNTSGIGRHLLNVSHVTMDDWQDAYQNGMGESLVIEVQQNINTGVMNFNNNNCRAKVRPVRIVAEAQLLDTYNWNGGFIGNFEHADARELILIEGASTSAALNFKGMHWECRDATKNAVVLVTGKWHSGTFSGNHISAGSGTDFTSSLFKFTGTASFRAVEMMGNEVLRLENGGSGGYIFDFENTVETLIDSPCSLGSWFTNITTPYLVNVDSGGNEETIYKSLLSVPNTVVRGATGRDRVYTLEDSATPSVQGGKVFEIPSAPTNTTITDLVDEYRGQEITLINTAGGAITLTHGANTIRGKGAADIVLGNNDSVRLTRTRLNHWIQTSEVIAT